MTHAGERARAAYVRRLAAQTRAHRRHEALNRLTELAASLLGATSAQVSLVSDVQHVVGGTGAAAPAVGSDSPADQSLVVRTVTAGVPVAVPDARADDQVAGLEPVTSGMVGAYLSVPLLSADGLVIGALGVFDPDPRPWSETDVALLQQLAASVVVELELASLTADYESDRVVWQLAVDAAGIGAFDWDVRTGELRWDDRLLELFGLTGEHFGGSIEDFNASVHPDDRARVSHALETALETVGGYAAEYRIVLPDGRTRWIAARGRALADGPDGPDCPDGSDGSDHAGGRARRLLGAAFDTTAAHDEEARVARVLESMPSAFFQLDHDWRFEYVNAEAERLLGRSREQLAGGSVWELFPAAVGSDFETHYRRAVESDEPVSFDAYYPPPLDAWYEVRAWPSPDGLAVYFIDVTSRHDAQRQLDASARRTALRARVGDALTGTLDAEEAVSRLAPLVVPDLGDWCVTTLVDEAARGDLRQGLRDVSTWHADPALREVVARYAEVRVAALEENSFLVRALTGSRPVVIPERATHAITAVLRPGEARDLVTSLAPETTAIVPLRGRGRTVALLTVVRGSDREPFTAEDLDLLADVAARAGLALDNARLYAEQRDLAEGLQRSLMTAPPDPEHLQVAVRYEPAAQAAQVGGDWYDAFLQHDGTTVLVIGDVVGHDTAAAAAMGQVRGLLRGIAVHSGEGPAAVLRGVDEVMETLQVDTTATAVVVRVEESSGDAGSVLRWSNAGHPSPVVIHPDGVVSALEPDGPGAPTAELLLGLDPGTERTETEVALAPGATVLLFTDGLVERRGQTYDEGARRLHRTLAELAPAGLGLDELCDEVLTRLLPDRPEDDVALVAVRLRETIG